MLTNISTQTENEERQDAGPVKKKNESIVIDDRIVLTVIEIRGDKIRLGIEAPREVSVHRSEVYEAIKAKSEQDLNPQSLPGETNPLS